MWQLKLKGYQIKKSKFEKIFIKKTFLKKQKWKHENTVLGFLLIIWIIFCCLSRGVFKISKTSWRSKVLFEDCLFCRILDWNVKYDEMKIIKDVLTCLWESNLSLICFCFSGVVFKISKTSLRSKDVFGVFKVPIKVDGDSKSSTSI